MICITSDWHVANHRRFSGEATSGLNDRCRRILAVIAASVDRCIALKAKAYIVAGDAFDTSRPSPQMLAAVQDQFRRLAEAGIPSFTLVGNHDQVSDAEGDHALNPLLPYTEIIERSAVRVIGNTAVYLVPYLPGMGTAKLSAELASLGSTVGCKHRVLITHVGIVSDDMPPWLKGAGAVPLAAMQQIQKDYNFDVIASGDYHLRKTWGSIYQIGALVPTGWDNPGTDCYGTLLCIDGKNVTVEELPGPRFISVQGLDDLPRKCAPGLYVSAQVAREEIAQAREILENAGAAGFEITPYRIDAQATARTAASAAKSAIGLQAALARYIDALAHDAVTKEAILGKCRRYLG